MSSLSYLCNVFPDAFELNYVFRNHYLTELYLSLPAEPSAVKYIEESTMLGLQNMSQLVFYPKLCLYILGEMWQLFENVTYSQLCVYMLRSVQDQSKFTNTS